MGKLKNVTLETLWIISRNQLYSLASLVLDIYTAMRWMSPVLLLEIYTDPMSPGVTENKKKHENRDRLGFYRIII